MEPLDILNGTCLQLELGVATGKQRGGCNARSAKWKPYTHTSRLLSNSLLQITDTPDAHGNTVVHVYRSWRSTDYLSLAIKAGDLNDTETKDWATIVSISWDENLGNMENTEEEVKEFAPAVRKRFLGCQLED